MKEYTMRNKRIIVASLIVVILLMATNIYTGIKFIKYRTILKSPPLIERIYTNIGNEVNYNNPIVFTGNSMIHRMNWNYIFRKVSTQTEQIPIIINRGIDGNTTYDLKRRLQSNILNLDPKAIFIEIGTNDIKNVTNSTNQNELIRSVVDNYKQITTDILNYSQNTQIYVISILPVLNNETRNQIAIKINAELLKFYSNNKNIHFIDCYNEFTENNELFIGPWTAHLNDKGYEKWAEILLPFVFEANNYSSN
jgi:lysophospholipase L1-like esterase